ncbi:hypothetical protein FKM82_014477 [Ascaphus truei]
MQELLHFSQPNQGKLQITGSQSAKIKIPYLTTNA